MSNMKFLRQAILTSIVIFSGVFLSACDDKKPYLSFNSEPISQKTVYDAQKIFKPGQPVNYVLLMPKGFEQEYLRLQIVKRADNIPQGGVTIYMAKDLFVDKSKKFYIDKFVIRQEGCYVVRFFYGNKTYKPFAENVLWVKN